MQLSALRLLIFQRDPQDDGDFSLIQQIPCQLLTAAVTVVLVFPFKCTSASGAHIIADLGAAVPAKVTDLLCGMRSLDGRMYIDNDGPCSLVSLTDQRVHFRLRCP